MSKAKIALLLSYICVASLSAAIITPALPQLQHSLHLSHGSLEWCFYVLFAHGLLMLAGTWLFPTPQHQAKPIKIMSLLHDYKLALQSKTLISYSLVIGFCSAFGYCYAAAAPLITHYLFHLSPSHYGYWNLLNMLGMFCSGFLTHRALKRFEPRQVIWFALIASGMCLLSLITLAYDIQTANVAWFFATTCALYLFTGMLFPCASLYASRAIACKASAASMMSFINMGSAMLAVIIMGYLPLSSLTGFITMMTVFLMIGLACLLVTK